MAIQFSHTDEFGNSNTQAYARIRNFTVDQPDHMFKPDPNNPGQQIPIEAIISCRVYIWKDYQAFLDGKEPHVKSYMVETDLVTAASATIMTAYDYIKSLPEYAGAIDVA